MTIRHCFLIGQKKAKIKEEYQTQQQMSEYDQLIIIHNWEGHHSRKPANILLFRAERKLCLFNGKMKMRSGIFAIINQVKVRL
jgi:hypothetical protein